MAKDLAVVVLAAGAGTRMKSDRPKVLHELAGAPLLAHVMATAQALEPARTIVVVAPGMEDVAAAAHPADIVVQQQALGTGDALAATRTTLERFTGDVLVMFGDTPLVRPRTLENLLSTRRGDERCAAAVLGMEMEEPDGYGRLVLNEEGFLDAIIEARDATPEQADITLCNSGVMALDGRSLFDLLAGIGNDNAKGEYYLTDIVAVARKRGFTCRVVIADDPEELIGVNCRLDLALAESAFQWRARGVAMENGATLIDPASVYFSFDTVLGRDVVIEPHVFFGPGVSVADGAVIRAFSHIEGAVIGPKAVVGPFARLRPGTEIGPEARIGNFVETKNTRLGKGAKANHLTYLGDARVGEGANVGAGTITCNYDGFAKHETVIGAGAFIGSDASLVAPVEIGKNAIVGAGSVITENVPDDALAVARGEQKNFPGKAKKFRDRRTRMTAKDE